MISALSGLEISLKEIGFNFMPGESVKAALKVLVG